MSVSHGIVAKLTSAAEFFGCRWFSQTVWRPYLQTGYAIFKITDFSYCLRFFTIFCLGKNFSPYFPFHNVGRSARRQPSYSLHTVSRQSLQHSSPLLLIRRRNTLPSIYFEMAEVNPSPATTVQLRLRKVLVLDELDDSCLDILRSGVCYFVDYRLRSYSWRKRKSSVGAT